MASELTGIQPQAGIAYEWTLTRELAGAGGVMSGTPDTVLLLEELLWGLEGLQGIEQVFRTDSDDILDYVEDGLAGLNHIEALKVFSADPEFADAIQVMLAETPELSRWVVSPVRPIRREDWAESWKAHWDVTPIHDRLTIRPSCLEYSAKSPDENVMTLDPGAAFGTGAHETSALMLRAMHELSKTVDFSRCSVLDVGTGSGILAVYAAMLGSRHVTGVDIDPNSPATALANAAKNHVESVCAFSNTPLEDLCQIKHDIVLANIIAPVIIALLPEMRKRLADDGMLLLSGLIEKNLPDIDAALSAQGLAVERVLSLGDWRALLVKAKI